MNIVRFQKNLLSVVVQWCWLSTCCLPVGCRRVGVNRESEGEELVASEGVAPVKKEPYKTASMTTTIEKEGKGWITVPLIHGCIQMISDETIPPDNILIKTFFSKIDVFQ